MNFVHRLACLVAAVALTASAAAQSPHLNVRVPWQTGVRQMESGLAVSNVQRIPLDVSLTGTGPLARLVSGFGDKRDTLEVEAWQIGPGERQRVPVSVILQSSGVERGQPTAGLLLVIPIPAEERTRLINEYIDTVNDGTPEQKEMLRQRRPQVVAALERLFFQNRVGRFEIQLRYRSFDPAYWTGEVGNSLTIDVANDGTFFDLLRVAMATPNPRSTTR